MYYSKQILIILFISLSLPLEAQQDILKKTITITIENKPVKDILLQISNKTGIGFSYGSEIFRTIPNKSVVAKEKPLKDVLNELFAGEKITYKVVGNQIVIMTLNNHTQNITVHGFVREQGSSESLIGVNVYVPLLQKGTVSNTYGFYSLTVPIVDTLTIVYSFVGYKPVTKQVTSSASEINIFLEPGTMLKEVVVNAEANSRQSESVQMSTISLPVAQIKNVPSLLGEKDVFKVLQLMPGVQKGMEGSSGLYVRGGGPDQNLIILDDAIVYNASHLFGFFSLFNGDALKSVELTKGGFPARYGGRLSSVIDMNMKEGNKEAWHGEGGIGLISSRLTVEGPLKKNKSSVLLSARRTYIDFISRPVSKATDNGNVGYYFYDMNAKINYDFGRKNKLYLSGYFGKDLFSMKTKTEETKDKAGFNWGNATATLRWNHLFNTKVFSNASLTYSKYNFQIIDYYEYIKNTRKFKAEYKSGIQDFSFKYDLDFLPNTKHWIRAGTSVIRHKFNPKAYVEEENSIIPVYKNDYEKIEALEAGIYLEDTYTPFNNLKINGGLRYSHFMAKKTNYKYIEPRISVAYRITNDLALKTSYASMNQSVHMLTNTGYSLPTDLWVPSNDKVHPQEASQFAIGLAKDLKNPLLFISLEGYYKKMDHIIGYKEGATYLDINRIGNNSETKWIENITFGKGWAYGAEVFIQKKVGKLNGWIGYTLSWTELQFDSLNFGKKFFARYDRRHDISVVGIYSLSDRITMSATWVYGTGNAISLPVSEYLAYSHNPYDYPINYTSESNLGISKTTENIETKNGFRMGPYHRLDFGIQFHKQKKWGERTWEVSVYNVYSRENPFFYYRYSDKGVEKLKQVSLFPIIPSVTYSFKF